VLRLEFVLLKEKLRKFEAVLAVCLEFVGAFS
jgi:hypothetical protein